MSIIKALEVVGRILQRPCFLHGLLCVGFPRWIKAKASSSWPQMTRQAALCILKLYANKN
jgi:hypothetical protein